MPDKMWMLFFFETTFTNDRQKAEVIVTKQDKDTENPLDGGIFGLYSASDITNADGAVVVKKGTLIQKATTGAGRYSKVYSRPATWIFL